jgi:hypothetical protein
MLGRVIPCDEKTIGTKAQGLTKDSAIAITVLDEQEKELSQYSMFIRLVVGKPIILDEDLKNKILKYHQELEAIQKELKSKGKTEKDQTKPETESALLLEPVDGILLEPDCPLEILFNSSESPDLEELRQTISAHIYEPNVWIFKWFFAERTWKLVKDEEKVVREKKGKSKSQKDFKLRGKPFEIKDGGRLRILADLIVLQIFSLL